jgi:hypothetical protein
LSISAARAIQSLVRAHWLTTLGGAVNGFTGITQIRHFVMAITGRRSQLVVGNRPSTKVPECLCLRHAAVACLSVNMQPTTA